MSLRKRPGRRHIVIPDLQVKPGVSLHHLKHAAQYIAAKTPDIIVQLGDWFDMKSLSSYDAGRLSSHGESYQADIAAGNAAIKLFEETLKRYSPRGYKPRKVITLGNHEERILRHIEAHPELKGKLGYQDFDFKRYGWEVYPFLKPVVIDGITYMHLCPLNAQGKVTSTKYGAPSAEAQAKRMAGSTICGHRQGLQTALIETPRGRIRGVISGSFYSHSEPYLGPLGNSTWMGILVLNDIRKGDFDLVECSLDYLRRRFG